MRRKTYTVLKTLERIITEEDDEEKKDNIDYSLFKRRVEKEYPKKPPEYVPGSDPTFDAHMERLRASLDSHFPKNVNKKLSPAEQMAAKGEAKLQKDSENLFNNIHATTEGKDYPDHIKGSLKEHQRDFELFAEPHAMHAFLGRTHALLSRHDPVYRGSDLAKETASHLILVKSKSSPEAVKHIEMAERLGGDVEALRGPATFNRDFDKYD